jgi:hypothetical protein
VDDSGKVPTRSQVVMCFVIGVAVFGFGTVATWSRLSGGPLHGRGWWQAAAGIPCMVLGLGLILGGGFGGLEAREAPKDNAGDPSELRPPGRR